MSKSKHAIGAAFLADVVVAILKIVAAVWTGSASLTAEAIHSFVDMGNQIFLFVGEKSSKKPASNDHPLGHGRESFFWSFVVAIMLFTLGGIFSIADGVYRLKTEELNYPGANIAILLVAAVAESYSLIVAMKQIRQEYDFKSYFSWFKKAKSPALLVIFSEDTAALAGILMALVCISLAWATGNYIWDAIGSIGVGMILVFVAFALATEIKSLIIGESPARNYKPSIKKILSETIPGGELRDYIAIQTGTDEVNLCYSVSVGKISDTKELVECFEKLEKKMGEQFPEIKHQFISPGS